MYIKKICTIIKIFQIEGFWTGLNYIFIKLKIPIYFNDIKKNEIINFLQKCKIYDTGHKLIRVGPKLDGGYLIPDILNQINYCYSPGVGESLKFEDDLNNKYNIICYAADGMIKKPNTIHNFLNKNIGLENSDTTIKLESWVDLNANDNLMLQMDIEGSEIAVLLNTPKNILKKFKIMVIEFHNFIDIRTKLGMMIYNTLFEKILEDHVICHGHPNNMGGQILINGIKIPRIIEFTFINKNLIKKKEKKNYTLPHSLDIKNYSAAPEIYLDKIFYS
jgi:hypothetical protein